MRPLTKLFRRLFRRRKNSHANIVLKEDRIRRALASGDFNPKNVNIFRALAQQRNKPGDLVFLHRELRRQGFMDLFDSQALEAASAWNENKRKAWAAKSGTPLRIAMFHMRDWHARLCEGVAELAGDQIVLKTDDEAELVVASPDVVISSYIHPETVSRMRARLPDTFWLYLRHGIANKKNSIENAGPFDAVCVTGQHVADFFTGVGFFPAEDVWITGYPPLDGFMPPANNSGQGPRTVLYAPTFNEYLSSAGLFGTGLIQHILAAAPDLQLIVKLHPETYGYNRKVWDTWEQACELEERAHFMQDRNTDVLSLYDQADILISDFSSAGFLFLATGRPIVLLTAEEASGDHDRYDPDGIEWKWRDMAEEVNEIDELTPVLRKILAGRDDYAEVRAQRRRMLFGDTLDGNSAARVMEKLGQVFGRNYP